VSNHLADVVAAATGAEHRDEPTVGRGGGPAGNARLTAWGGLLLLVLFLVESATLISLGGMISVHIVVGTLLVPLALLKTATTGWRIVRYYAGDPAYRQAGPPPLLLRVWGPLVIVMALAVLGSGLALIALGQGGHDEIASVLGFRIDAITVHQACFVGWLVAVGVHVLTRTVPAVQVVAGATPAGRAIPGAPSRLALLALTVAAGAVASAVVLNYSGNWTSG
jgi:hypothetical protein